MCLISTGGVAAIGSRSRVKGGHHQNRVLTIEHIEKWIDIISPYWSYLCTIVTLHTTSLTDHTLFEIYFGTIWLSIRATLLTYSLYRWKLKRTGPVSLNGFDQHGQWRLGSALEAYLIFCMQYVLGRRCPLSPITVPSRCEAVDFKGVWGSIFWRPPPLCDSVVYSSTIWHIFWGVICL